MKRKELIKLIEKSTNKILISRKRSFLDLKQKLKTVCRN